MSNNIYIIIIGVIIAAGIGFYVLQQKKIKEKKIKDEHKRIQVLNKKQTIRRENNSINSPGTVDNINESNVIDDPEEIKSGQPIIRKKTPQTVDKNVRKRAVNDTKKEQDYSSEIKNMYQGSVLIGDEPKRTEAQRPLIMIVDDSKSALFYAERILKQEYDTITALDGQDALKKMEKNRPNLVITDADMPVLDGFGLLLKMKSDIGLASIPVIMATGKIELHAKIGAEKGLQGFLTKPYDADSLLDQVSYLLENN